jgi:hypothetical protein
MRWFVRVKLAENKENIRGGPDCGGLICLLFPVTLAELLVNGQAETGNPVSAQLFYLYSSSNVKDFHILRIVKIFLV